MPPTFILDPGHGGNAPNGKSTPRGMEFGRGVPEKLVTLDVARRVVARLGGAVQLTRTGDTNPTLTERALTARRHGAQAFVSVHVRGDDSPGAGVYVHPQAGPASTQLAQAMCDELRRDGWPTLGVRSAEMAVLSPALLGGQTPACLLELDGATVGLNARTGASAQNLDRAALAIARALGCVRQGGVPARSLGLWDDIVDGLRDATDPIAFIFHRLVDTNRVVARSWSLPATQLARINAYIAANPADGALIQAGLDRDPSYYIGGWILDVQTNAGAMTLDRAIFFRNDPPRLSTVVHELVHVGQYGILGPTAFLLSYFGLSAATIAWRLVNREPIDAMESSPHERQAYDVGNRFAAWDAATPTSLGLSDAWGAPVPARALDNAPLMPSGFWNKVRSIVDWAARGQRFQNGVSDTGVFPHSAICRLTTSAGSGTGFYIGHNRILTAAHMITDVDGTVVAWCDVAPAQNGPSKPFGQFRVLRSAIHRYPSYVDTPWTPEYDIAVLEVASEANYAPYGAYFEMDGRMASLGSVVICGYAADTVDPQRQHLDVDFIRDIGGLDSEGAYNLADYNARTEHGTSGSPVFVMQAVNDEAGQVCMAVATCVGVHVSGNTAQNVSGPYNTCSKLTVRKLAWINAI